MNWRILRLRRVPFSMLNHTYNHSRFPSLLLPLGSESHVNASSLHAFRHFHSTLLANVAASNLNEAQSDASEEIVDRSNKTKKQADNIDASKPADYNPSTSDPSESRSVPSEKILKIVDEIANLTLLEASDLSYLLKKKLGLPDSAMPYYGGMGGGQGGGGGGSASASAAQEEEKKPEKTNFDIRLEKFEASAKIKVIKEVRTFTDLGLKEAKELVEKLPAILKKGVLKEEADQIVEKLKAIGASAILE